MAIYRRLSLNSEIFEPKNDIYWVFKSTQFNLKKKVIDTTNYIIIPFILLVGFIKDNVISLYICFHYLCPLYVFTIYVYFRSGLKNEPKKLQCYNSPSCSDFKVCVCVVSQACRLEGGGGGGGKEKKGNPPKTPKIKKTKKKKKHKKK